MLRSIPLQFEPHTRNYGIGIRNRCSADSSHQRCSFHHALGWESFIRHSFFLLNHFSSFEEIVAALAREVNAKENENRGRKSAAPTKPRLFHCAPEQLFGGVMGLPQARSTGISESLNRGSLLFLLCCVSFVQRTTVVYFYRRPPPPPCRRPPARQWRGTSRTTTGSSGSPASPSTTFSASIRSPVPPDKGGVLHRAFKATRDF